jgi:hypothetical protein
MKQRPNLSMSSFSTRIEEFYHQLTTALSVGKTPAEAITIASTVQFNALGVLMEGINPSIRLILEARDIQSYDQALRIAIEKEKVCDKNENWKNKNSNNFNKGTNNYYNHRNNKANIKCHKCNRFGHYERECRTNVPQSSGIRNPTNNRAEVKTDYVRNNVKFCKCCKRPNHDISECCKRIVNENKNKRDNDKKNTDENKTIS